jgi:uncharacterized protein (DUF433 family)
MAVEKQPPDVPATAPGPVPSAGEPRLVKAPGVCGGDARVRGTRLAVWGLEERRRLGWSDAQILDNFPQLAPEDLTPAWAYAAEHRDEIDRAIRENQEA